MSRDGTSVAGDREMRPGETAIRTDPVILTHTSTIRVWPNTSSNDGLLGMYRATMIVSTERLVFLPPRARTFEHPLEMFQYVPLIGSVLQLLSVFIMPFPPLHKRRSFELTEIDRFWKWHPEFSGPPMFQLGPESWTFRLCLDDGRRPRFARHDAVKEHFNAVEAAWARRSQYGDPPLVRGCRPKTSTAIRRR
jgi:hypothetical protein